MTAEQEKALEQVLLADLGRAIDFVKFAETKNAGMVTLASAWLLAAAAMAANDATAAHVEIRDALVWGTPWVAVAGALALSAFLPKIDLKKLLPHEPNPHSNYLFFGDLRRMRASTAWACIRDRYVTDGGRLSETYFQDLGCQLVINARIAHGKFQRFGWAAWSLGIGVVFIAWNAARLVY